MCYATCVIECKCLWCKKLSVVHNYVNGKGVLYNVLQVYLKESRTGVREFPWNWRWCLGDRGSVVVSVIGMEAFLYAYLEHPTLK